MALTQVQSSMLAGSTSSTTTIQSNGTTAITIDSSQNVGIGTSSPASYGKFAVVGTGNVSSVIGNGTSLLISQANTVGGSWTQYYKDTTPTYVAGIGTYSPVSNTAVSALVFGDYQGGWVERMRIDSSGNLLVGTTSPVSGAADGIQLRAGNGNSKFSVNNTGNNVQIYFYNGNGAVGSINTNASVTTYNSLSDYRLKDNPQPMTKALDKVAQLKPVTYTWKVDGSAGQGFIAHELAEVVPECVVGEKDAVDAEGKPVYQGIDTSFLVATLTAAIQELNAKVEAQAAEIEALKATK